MHLCVCTFFLPHHFLSKWTYFNTNEEVFFFCVVVPFLVIDVTTSSREKYWQEDVLITYDSSFPTWGKWPKKRRDNFSLLPFVVSTCCQILPYVTRDPAVHTYLCMCQQKDRETNNFFRLDHVVEKSRKGKKPPSLFSPFYTLIPPSFSSSLPRKN